MFKTCDTCNYTSNHESRDTCFVCGSQIGSAHATFTPKQKNKWRFSAVLLAITFILNDFSINLNPMDNYAVYGWIEEYEISHYNSFSLANFDKEQQKRGIQYDEWNVENVYQNAFMVNGEPVDSENALGMYVPSSTMTRDGNSVQTMLALKPGEKEIGEFRFSVAADSNWCYGDKKRYGTFQIDVMVNDEVIASTGEQDYRYNEAVAVHPEKGVRFITLRLTETKGTDGTLNIVLYDFKRNTPRTSTSD